MSRHCYAVGCSNGGYRLKRWAGVKCPKHPGVFQGDYPCDCPPPFRLFNFPCAKKNPEARQQWLMVLNRADPQRPHTWLQPSRYQVLCSTHFVDGEPTPAHPDPELLLNPSITSAPEPKASHQQRQERYVKRQLFGATADPSTSCSNGDPGSTDFQFQLPAVPAFVKFIFYILLAVIRTIRKENELVTKEVQKLKHQVSRQKQFIRSNYHRKKTHHTCTFDNIIENDKDANFFTGINTKSLIVKLHDFIVPFVRRRWKGAKRVVSAKTKRNYRCNESPKKFGPGRKITSQDEFLLTLMKLRLDLLHKDLAKRFSISLTLCSQIFHSWLAAMHKILCPVLVFWPSKDQVQSSKPSRYSALPDIRAIIDCTEIFIQTPKDPNIQNMTWSSYKHHNTAKILVACAPNSAITFLSSAYGGRTSDKDITNDSGFLDKCEQHDMIQADKGFNITDECAARLIHLHVPPGLRGEVQMATHAVSKTKRIAALRILVEQVIRRLKSFRILSSQVSVTLLPSLDQIVNVCAAISNLKRPIYKD